MGTGFASAYARAVVKAPMYDEPRLDRSCPMSHHILRRLKDVARETTVKRRISGGNPHMPTGRGRAAGSMVGPRQYSRFGDLRRSHYQELRENRSDDLD